MISLQKNDNKITTYGKMTKRETWWRMPSKEEKISLGAANTKSAQLFYISPSDIDHKSEFNLLEIIEEGP